MRMLVQIQFHFTLITFYNALNRTNFHRDKLWLILTRGIEDRSPSSIPVFGRLLLSKVRDAPHFILEDLLTCFASTSAMSSFSDRLSHRASTPPTRGRGRGGGGPRQRRSTIRHLERVSALRHGCGRTGMPTPPSPAALCRNSIPGG